MSHRIARQPATKMRVSGERIYAYAQVVTVGATRNGPVDPLVQGDSLFRLQCRVPLIGYVQYPPEPSSQARLPPPEEGALGEGEEGAGH